MHSEEKGLEDLASSRTEESPQIDSNNLEEKFETISGKSTSNADNNAEESEDDSAESRSTNSDTITDEKPERKVKRGLLEEKLDLTVESLYSRPIVDFFENLQAPLIGSQASSEMEDEVREQQIRLMLLEKRIEELQIRALVLERNQKPKETILLQELEPVHVQEVKRVFKYSPKKKVQLSDLPMKQILTPVSTQSEPKRSPKPKSRPPSAKTMKRISQIAAIYGMNLETKKVGVRKPSSPSSTISTLRQPL